MKKLFLGICALMTVFPLLAQQRRIIVSDAQTRQPLAGATIELTDGTSMVADQDGRILLPIGASKLAVSCIGYRTNKLALAGQDTILLERLNLFLQPVEVKAMRAGDKAPFARTNLTAKDIEKQNLGQDLPFLLNQTPSVVVNSDAGNGVGYTGIRIRGTDATRINMTLNGIPYNDAESQGLYFVDLPDFASSVNSIQIQRGVGTSSNGAGAFGATLSLGTNEFNESPYGELNNSYGSFNTWKNTVKAGSGLINNHFTIDARLSRISSDGYMDRANSNLGSFYLSGAYLSKKSSLRLNIFSGKEKTYQVWNGVLQSDLENCRTCNSAGTEKPGKPYENQTDNYQQDHYQLFFNHAFTDKLSLNTAAFLSRGRGYYEEYKAGQAYADYGLPNPVFGDTTLENTDLVRQLWLDNYYYGGIYSLHYKNKGTQLTFGGGYNQYKGRHYGKIIWAGAGIPDNYKWYDLDALKTDLSFYGKWQQQVFGHWQTFLDLQYRRVKYDINGFEDNPSLLVSNTYNFLNPKAGISYSKNYWTVFGSFSAASKEPNRDDFEADLNHQPKKETLNDYEFGVEHRRATTNWSANLYYMNYHDQLVLTGKLNDVGAYTRTNIDRSYRLGVELQGSIRPVEWMQLSGNMTLSENKVLDFKEYLDDYDEGGQKINQYHKTDISFSPAFIAGATASFIPIRQGEIALIGKYVGRQFLDNTSNTQRSLNAFYVQDLRLRYTVKEKLLHEINFIFQVNNLFNKLYEPNGYTFSYIYNKTTNTENYVYPMAGINCMAAVNIRL
ncbi:TonB-dependent receptor [Flavihumibacter profundi]|uniref:TonB-dependent receptor n=1 Tax=Flavihumibacter profundi TaxID=2716883 RepID=UPI001CC7383B|nr:TonB-dependent receptor plug domain-containing protein [Flavihumibacter profundi]MBZ5857248.1 TonB-dependent receptor [Flavihumibacter profundi]